MKAAMDAGLFDLNRSRKAAIKLGVLTESIVYDPLIDEIEQALVPPHRTPSSHSHAQCVPRSCIGIEIATFTCSWPLQLKEALIDKFANLFAVM